MNKSPSTETEKQKKILLQISAALIESGYDPVRQITGYLVSEDPTYIPDYKNARKQISEIDRELLISILIRNYLTKE